MAVVPLLLVLGNGCSGINTSQSISPASFFLPGFSQVTPSVVAPAVAGEPVPAVPVAAAAFDPAP